MTTKHTLWIFLAVAASVFAAPHSIDLAFESLTLRNGRAFEKGVIKSFDPVSGRVVIQAGRSLSSHQIALLPEAEAAKVKSLVPDIDEAAARVEQERRETEARTAEARRASEQVKTRAAEDIAANQANARAAQAADAKAAQARTLLHAQAKRIAQERANDYYRYEFRPGSGSVLIIGQGVRVSEPREVAGWNDRLRVTGTVGLEFFDSRGRSFERVMRSFEVLVGPDDAGHLVVLEFIAK